MLQSIDFFPVSFKVRIHSKKQLIIFSNILRDMGIDITDIDIDFKDILTSEKPIVFTERKELTLDDIIKKEKT